ncbi:hypothetical protein E2C01_017026 [Portunus trituberculatus]|uniref:Secreted protein n=1 Tax=Portunus trituberculatus TaxID=210409 RepID=A0A5B7DS22_PORTR|nr:hypothetical protein [Portunus trituberculatus]
MEQNKPAGSERNTAMRPLPCLCLVVLMAVPALQEGVQEGVSPPRMSSLLVSETAVTPTPRSGVIKPIDKSLKTTSVTKKRKAKKTIHLCPNNTDVVSCYSISHHNYEFNITKSSPCVIKCSYDPRERHESLGRPWVLSSLGGGGLRCPEVWQMVYHCLGDSVNAVNTSGHLTLLDTVFFLCKRGSWPRATKD